MDVMSRAGLWLPVCRCGGVLSVGGLGGACESNPRAAGTASQPNSSLQHREQAPEIWALGMWSVSIFAWSESIPAYLTVSCDGGGEDYSVVGTDKRDSGA